MLAGLGAAGLAVSAELWVAAAVVLPGLLAVGMLWRWRRLAASGTFLARVIDAMPGAVCVFDAQGRLRLLNGCARSIFARFVPGMDFAALVDLANATVTPSGEELRLPDGRCFTVAQSGPVDGGIRVIALNEVTAARRAEEERRHMLEFLSHDMRSPQVAILGLSQDNAACAPAPERLRRIRRLARRTLKLADDFVQLSRLSEVALELEEVDLAALVGEALDTAWFAAREKRITLVRDVPDTPVCVRADGHVLARAVDNLLDNAIRHGPEGSRVVVTVRAIGSKARLVIRDEGPGLPEARRGQPFQRFGPSGFSAAGPTGAGPTGAGLGLSFVKAAVEKHGGTIACRSSRKRGTAFAIDLDRMMPA